MTTAIKPWDYATDGNYPAGSDDWSGQPRAVKMTATEKKAGATPNTPFAAQLENGRLQELYEAQSALAINAMRTWRRVNMAASTGAGAALFKQLATCPLPNSKQHAVVALGYDAANSNHFIFERTFGSGEADPTSHLTTHTRPLCVGGGKSGEFFYGLSGGVAGYTNLAAGGDADLTVYTSTANPVALHYMLTADVYLVAQSDGSVDRCAGTLVGPTPYTNIAGVGGATAFTAATSDTPGGEFEDNGANDVVFLGLSTVGGVSRYRAFHSGDAGATWTLANTFGSGLTSANLVYNKPTGAFIILLSDGTVWTSTTGGGFVLQNTVTFPASVSGGAQRHKTFASAGYCIAKILQPSFYSTFTPTVVAYSFDNGLTWRLQILDATLDPTALIADNNRFYLSTGGELFTSGCLAYEASDV